MKTGSAGAPSLGSPVAGPIPVGAKPAEVKPAGPLKDWPLLAVLVAATALAPFALQIFLPALPVIQESYQASAAEVQLTFSLSTLVIAFAALFYGPISDRVGRRPAMFAGMAIFVVGSAMCALAPTIEWLIVARVVQAAGGGVGLVLSRAILRDLYPPEQAAAGIAYVTMGMVVAPTLAPSIGGVVVDAVGWRWVFWLCLVIGALVMAGALKSLRETVVERSGGGFDARRMALDFRALLGCPRYTGYALQVAFAFSVWMVFLAAAPYVLITLMGLSPSAYGLTFVLVSGTYILGNFAAARITKRVGVDRMILIGSSGLFCAIVILTIDVLLTGATVWGIFVPMTAAAFFQGLLMPNSQAGLVSVYPRMAGSASGLGTALQMAVAAVGVQVIGSIQIGSAVPMVLGMLAMSACLSAAVWLQRRAAARVAAGEAAPAVRA